MWRIELPGGSLSDMVNISRAKDAAMVMAEHGPPARSTRMLHWRKEYVGQPVGILIAPRNPTTCLNQEHSQVMSSIKR
jgi:hypothetical protein